MREFQALSTTEREKKILVIYYRPRVSIVVTTYNRARSDVLECLESVKSQSYRNFEAILVDNSSRSPSVFSSSNIGHVKLVDATGRENFGVPGGRNVGIKNASGEYLFFVDDDAVLDKDCLLELLKAADGDPSIGVVGPLTYRYDRPTERWFYEDLEDRGDIVDFYMIVGAALMVRRKVLEKIGLFDEIYFLYHEEFDLCYRAQRAGYRTVISKRASCWHKVPQDDSDKLFSPLRSYYWHRNFFIFAGRNEKTTIGAISFLLRNLISTGRSFPFFFVTMALKAGKLDALKSYFLGVAHGVVWFFKLRLAS